jgi:5-oxoprolinase (ATP-hydrolysing)
MARCLGFDEVFLGHKASRQIKPVARGDTTVADAYPTPILRRHVDHVRGALGPDKLERLMSMRSNGGWTDADLFLAGGALLSGPGGGPTRDTAARPARV